MENKKNNQGNIIIGLVATILVMFLFFTVFTSSLSADVAALRENQKDYVKASRIKDLEDSVNESLRSNNEKFSSLENRVWAVEYDTSKLNGYVDSIDNDVIKLYGRICDLEDKMWTLVEDKSVFRGPNLNKVWTVSQIVDGVYPSAWTAEDIALYLVVNSIKSKLPDIQTWNVIPLGDEWVFENGIVVFDTSSLKKDSMYAKLGKLFSFLDYSPGFNFMEGEIYWELPILITPSYDIEQ